MSERNEFIRGKPADASGEQLVRFFFKAVTVTLIFIGIWASTQRFASLVNHDPGWCGKPFYVIRLGSFFQYPLYQPFGIFYRMLIYYKQTAIHPFLYRAFGICGFFSGTAIVFYFLMEFILIRNRKQNVFGTARWGTDKDMKAAGLLGLKGGMIVGQTADARLTAEYDMDKNSVGLHLLKKGRQYLIQAGIYNMLLAAPTRSGKGVSNVIPTLLSYPGSMIVLDFKGENFNTTSGFRAKFGKVYRWEPVGYGGHHFNPMMEIRGGEDAFSDANLIADILTTPASGGASNSSSEHFITAARDFLTSLILHCLCSDWPDKSLPGCRAFLAQTDPEDPENNKYIYDLMINAEHGDSAIHQSVVEGAGAQRKRPNDEGGSVLSTVNNALAVFADAKIKRNTADSEFYIDEFEKTKVPITLYITIQYSDVQRISPLIRMFVTLFSRRFTSGETQATKRKFEIPLLFILDEFDKLGKMDELEMNMGIHNGFGIHYFLIFQSINQLNKIYTKDHSFLAHCRNSIFFAPGAGEYDNAELISKICGKESINRVNISYSGNRGSAGYGNASLSSQDQERNLINADEIMKLPLDRFILLVQGMPPYIGKKNVYYEDPVFTSRITEQPAFSTREEAAAAVKDAAAKDAAAKDAADRPRNGPRWFDLAGDMKKLEKADEEAEQRDVELSDETVAALYAKYGDGETPDPGTGETPGADAETETDDDAFESAGVENFL